MYQMDAFVFLSLLLISTLVLFLNALWNRNETRTKSPTWDGIEMTSRRDPWYQDRTLEKKTSNVTCAVSFILCRRVKRRPISVMHLRREPCVYSMSLCIGVVQPRVSTCASSLSVSPPHQRFSKRSTALRFKLPPGNGPRHTVLISSVCLWKIIVIKDY